MYVKEDIILPHHYTFYDLIVTKARGKSGPLFIFDCHDDIRITNDATVEKEESHAGKVILRSWYERHKWVYFLLGYLNLHLYDHRDILPSTNGAQVIASFIISKILTRDGRLTWSM